MLYVSEGIVAQPSIQQYQSVAKHFPTILFLHTYNQDILDKYQPANNILMFAKHLKEPLHYPSAQIDERGLIIFIESNRYPEILEFDMDSANLIFGGQRSVLVLFYRGKRD